jgi:nucleoside-diphosphate-sugar epimerase
VRSGTGILISPTTIPGTLEAKIWSDANTASLASIPSSHLHRETDLFLLLPSHQLSIHITIIAPSAIHGMGLGPPALSNQFSVQIPWLVSNAIKLGKMHMVGRGENWSCQVHVRDLVEFYTHLLDLYPTGPTSSRIEVELPTGYCFPVPASSGGEVKMKDLVDALAKEMKAQGLLESAEVVEVDPSDESLKKVFGSSAGKWLVGGNCRVRGVEAESTGWVAKEEGVLGKEGLREVVREVGRAVSEGRYKGFGEGGSRSDGRYKD